VCYKSLFLLKLLAEEDREARLFRQLGIFMYLRTALGSREKFGRCIFFLGCTSFYINYSVATANGNYLQNREESMQLKDLLKLSTMSLFLEVPSTLVSETSPKA